MELNTLIDRAVEIRNAASNPNGAIKQRLATAAITKAGLNC